MNILLIAGHGQGDSGATGLGYKECDLTRELVNLIKPKLSKYADVDVFDTSKNMYKYLSAGNTFDFTKYKYVFEVHFNACVKDFKGNGYTTGTEICVHETEKGTSVEKYILNNISALGFKNRGIKPRNDLKGMNTCKRKQGVSYALLETCFIDDKDDMVLYEKTKDKIADAVVSGVVKGFGLKKKESETMGFKDIKGHYAETYINDLMKMGIVKGDENGNFNPNEPLKRCDAAIMLRNTIKFITGS